MKKQNKSFLAIFISISLLLSNTAVIAEETGSITSRVDTVEQGADENYFAGTLTGRTGLVGILRYPNGWACDNNNECVEGLTCQGLVGNKVCHSGSTQVTNLAALALSSTEIQLNWDELEGIDSYKLEIYETSDLINPVQTIEDPLQIAANASTYTATGLSEAVEYQFSLTTKTTYDAETRESDATTTVQRTLENPLDVGAVLETAFTAGQSIRINFQDGVVQDASNTTSIANATNFDQIISATADNSAPDVHLIPPTNGLQSSITLIFNEALNGNTIILTNRSFILSNLTNDIFAATPPADTININSAANSVVWNNSNPQAPTATITIPATTFVTGETLRLNFLQLTANPTSCTVQDLAGNGVLKTTNIDQTVSADTNSIPLTVMLASPPEGDADTLTFIFNKALDEETTKISDRAELLSDGLNDIGGTNTSISLHSSINSVSWDLSNTDVPTATVTIKGTRTTKPLDFSGSSTSVEEIIQQSYDNENLSVTIQEDTLLESSGGDYAGTMATPSLQENSIASEISEGDDPVLDVKAVAHFGAADNTSIDFNKNINVKIPVDCTLSTPLSIYESADGDNWAEETTVNTIEGTNPDCYVSFETNHLTYFAVGILYPACTEADWSTSEWSDCDGTNQTRTASKNTQCRGDTGKPDLSKTCTISVPPAPAPGGGGGGSTSGPDTETPYKMPLTESTQIVNIVRPVDLSETNGIFTRALELKNHYRNYKVFFNKGITIKYEDNSQFNGTISVPDSILKNERPSAPSGYQEIRVIKFNSTDNQTIYASANLKITLPISLNQIVDPSKIKSFYHDGTNYTEEGTVTVSNDQSYIEIETTKIGTFGVFYQTQGAGDEDIVIESQSEKKEEEKTKYIFQKFFTDISDHWSQEYVENLYDEGVFIERKNFEPNKANKRSHFVKMVVEAFDLPFDANDGKTEFPDVPENEWYAPYVKAAFKAGVIKGYTVSENSGKKITAVKFNDYNNNVKEMQILLKNLGYFPYLTTGYFGPGTKASLQNFQTAEKLSPTGTVNTATLNRLNSKTNKTIKLFKPRDTVNRAEVLKILLEVKKIKDLEKSPRNHKFTDVPAGVWYEKYVNFAYENKIVKGKKEHIFAPSRDVTRAETAKILYLIKKLEN